MAYKVKKEKVDELKDGRKNIIIAEKIGCNPQYLGKVFLGERNCSKRIAILLVSINQKFAIENHNVDEMISKYFDEVE